MVGGKMRRIYIYMFACLSIGIVLFFKADIRQYFSEDISSPSPQDLAWEPVLSRKFKQKINVGLHYFASMTAREFLSMKLGRLDGIKSGIGILVLAGSSKLPTNEYLRILARRDWGIEEIRLHGTDAVNPYAFINLIKSNPSIKGVYIWGVKWKEEILEQIRKSLPKRAILELMGSNITPGRLD
jgi:hypothetical protein